MAHKRYFRRGVEEDRSFERLADLDFHERAKRLVGTMYSAFMLRRYPETERLQEKLDHSSGFLRTKGGETAWLYRVNSRPKSFII